MPWLRHLAVLFTFLAAFVRPAPASAFAPANPEIRVGAFEVAVQLLAGELGAASREQHQGIAAAYDENASGYRFAAVGAGETATAAGAGAARAVDEPWMGGEFLGDDLRFPGRAPQGIIEHKFVDASARIRSRVGGLSDDIVVQGSRATGKAKPTSDIDFAVRVSPEEFATQIELRFGSPRAGTAKHRTMQHAVETGKIQAGEMGWRGLRRELEHVLGVDVDISLIRAGGPFDQSATIPIAR